MIYHSTLGYRSPSKLAMIAATKPAELTSHLAPAETCGNNSTAFGGTCRVSIEEKKVTVEPSHDFWGHQLEGMHTLNAQIGKAASTFCTSHVVSGYFPWYGTMHPRSLVTVFHTKPITW